MKALPCTQPQLRALIAQYPTPFHLYDEEGIRKTARDLNAAFAWNPGFKEYFAVKALPNPYILEIMRHEGCGVDCASMAELMLAKAVGFSGEEIMFSSNVTPAEEYVYARSLDSIINLDDFTHIEFLEKNGGIPELICCRFNPGGGFLIGNQVMGNPGDAKYGFTFAQLVDGMKLLALKGAKRFGIHAFLASNTIDNEYYAVLAKTLFETAVQLRDLTGISLEFINLSGGVGIAYKPEQKQPDIFAIGEAVRKAYAQVLAPAGMTVAIKTELGRFMTGSHGCLVTTALHEKHIYKEYIGLDACCVDLMRPAMYGSYHHITVVGKEHLPCDHVYDITGSLCENNDKFAVDRALPKIDLGDILVIHDTGAHGYSMGYNYNGKLKHAEILLQKDGSGRMIRRAETEQDYFATLEYQPLNDMRAPAK